jgi:hypothetical protein
MRQERRWRVGPLIQLEPGNDQVWAGASGAMLRKATQSVSSHTNRAGSSPAMIFENTDVIAAITSCSTTARPTVAT